MVKKLLCFALSVLLFTTPVFADVTSITEKIVTEYYSDDLYDNIEENLVQTSTNGELLLNSPSNILIEQSTGKVLSENNADEKRSPASITKIMSLLLIMEAIENKKINLTDSITCSEHAASMGGSQIWLEPFEQMSVDDLLKASVIGSANDATCLLAEAVSGSEEGFVNQMNERAKELGMENTNFKNCTGLDEEGHYTTARDIAIMSAELLNYDLIRQYTSIWMDTLRGGKTQLVNTNKLVRFYNGATGLKTGTTDQAGCCVSASAKRDNLELIAVVLGANNSNERFADAKALLNYGFANYIKKSIDIKLPQNFITLAGGDSPICPITVSTIHDIIIDSSNADKIEVEYLLAEGLEAPIKKDDVVGYVKIKCGDDQLEKINVVAAMTVNKMSYATALSWLFGALFNK